MPSKPKSQQSNKAATQRALAAPISTQRRSGHTSKGGDQLKPPTATAPTTPIQKTTPGPVQDTVAASEPDPVQEAAAVTESTRPALSGGIPPANMTQLACACPNKRGHPAREGHSGATIANGHCHDRSTGQSLPPLNPPSQAGALGPLAAANVMAVEHDLEPEADARPASPLARTPSPTCASPIEIDDDDDDANFMALQQGDGPLGSPRGEQTQMAHDQSRLGHEESPPAPSNCDAQVLSLTNTAINDELMKVLVQLNSGIANPYSASICISPPNPEDPNVPALGVWLGQIPEALAARLSTQSIWSFTKITFTPLDLLDLDDIRAPDLLMLLKNFIDHATDKIVRDAIISRLNDPDVAWQITGLISDDQPSNDNMNVLAGAAEILDLIEVEHIEAKAQGGTRALLWKVKLRYNPFHHIEIWVFFHNLLVGLSYPTNMAGIGEPYFPRPCAICSCVSHMRGLCTLPSLPGWNGPTTATIGLSCNMPRRGTPAWNTLLVAYAPHLAREYGKDDSCLDEPSLNCQNTRRDGPSHCCGN
ncbi:hypothetical protein GLOTRDRAFT_90427 [Gloeophyllum trabeum ATCC 11539]|uniref:Uncharacterized protein n=1 Tax=Gloeophyllum trabeum (strain ATCC 11539 / FP-39264 / Madison 617) TaxID=670483 RepID=S7QNS1_GLOTA|nr:uncharacterized protein GLOTRDRAFT_90427 [Gloeophyllum trabeum ATCC 11539]EPQ61173.1 hypothetical protein GLOTRDRAFT_90427 [Gloeophyllum trabeum ATCC 11539]